MRASSETPPKPPASCWSAAACAERYDREVNRAFYQAAVARLLDGSPELRGSGLDLGCGTGFSTEVLVARQPGVAWQGVDASTAMLEIARGKPALAGVELRRAGAETLPFADGSFDVVVASFSWHWFGEGAGQELRRIMRPGGWLLASVPVRRLSSAAGNRLLARELLSGRHRYSKRTSQGFRLADVAGLLPPPFRVVHDELHVEREWFADAREMLEVLASRGALTAVFGDDPPAVLEAAGRIEYEWPYVVLHARI